MTVKVTMPNNSSDSVDFINATVTTLAQVKAYDGGSSNGSLAFNTTASGTSTERVRVDSSGNVGIGQTPTAYGSTVRNVEAYIAGASGYTLVSAASASVKTEITSGESALLGQVGTRTNHPLAIKTNDTERARIDTSGNLLVNRTNQTADQGRVVMQEDGATKAVLCLNNTDTGASSQYLLRSIRNGNTVGGITNTNVATAFPTSSDYRLKENIAPMTGALSVVSQLKPVTYNWKTDGSDGQGFIAHELQAVVPDAVVGEKDAVDADGNPVYQGIDTSFLVATLTAAIQELSAKNDALEARLAALENK